MCIGRAGRPPRSRFARGRTARSPCRRTASGSPTRRTPQGASEIYLRPFGRAGGTIPVSSDGGSAPNLGAGREGALFPTAGSKLMRAPAAGAPLRIGSPSLAVSLPSTVVAFAVPSPERILTLTSARMTPRAPTAARPPELGRCSPLTAPQIYDRRSVYIIRPISRGGGDMRRLRTLAVMLPVYAVIVSWSLLAQGQGAQPAGAGARVVFQRSDDPVTEVAQHRQRQPGRPRLGDRRARERLRPRHRRQRLGRRVQVHQRRRRPGRRSSTTTAPRRSATSRSTRRTRTSSGSAPARSAAATRRPGATASTSPPTAARPSRTWG